MDHQRVECVGERPYRGPLARHAGACGVSPAQGILILKADHIIYLVHTVLRRLSSDDSVAPPIYSQDAVALVLRTGAAESGYRSLFQDAGNGFGPAGGFFQIEPATARSIINDYIEYRPEILREVEKATNSDLSKIDDPEEDSLLRLQLAGNIPLGIALCRLKYRVSPLPIPPADDLEAQGEYWLKIYNAGGKGTVKKFLEAAKLVGPIF